MITPTVKVNEDDVKRLNKLLNFVADNTSRSMSSLVKQSAITAIQSAAVATKPGTQASTKGLAQKFKYRPIVGMKAMFAKGSYMYKSIDTDKIFVSDNFISEPTLIKRHLRLIKFAFKAWSKKANKWSFIPYFGSKTSGFDPSAKGGKIPGYGAAKSGWLKALRFFGKPENTADNVKGQVSSVNMNLTGKNPFASITNLVDYVSKIAPDSARIGIQKATNRLEHVLLPKLSKELQDKWNKS